MKVSGKIKFPLYGCVLSVIFTDNPPKEVNAIRKKYKEVSELDKDVEGVFVAIDSTIVEYFLIIDFKYLTHNTIAHESYHAVKRITKDRDIEDEESEAWISGFISGNIYKLLDKRGIKVKHDI